MKGDNTFYIYIDPQGKLSMKTASPVRTAGSPIKYFSDRDVEYFWEIGLDEPSTYIEAVAEALQKGADPESVHNLISRMTATNNVIEEFLKGRDIGVIYENDSVTLTDGEREEVGADITTAFYNWFTPEVETKNKNTHQDEVKDDKEDTSE